MPRIPPNLMSQEAGRLVGALKAQDGSQGQRSHEGFGSGPVKEMESGKGSLGGREWLLLESGERWRCCSHNTVSPSKAVVAGYSGWSMHLALKGLGLGSWKGHLPWCHVHPVE